MPEVQCDALVIGGGVAGAGAAFALQERGKSVVVIAKGPGASAVSSGAWDFGPVENPELSLPGHLETRHWKQVYKDLLVAGQELPAWDEWSESIAAAFAALHPELPMASRWEAPALVPCTSGYFRYVFALQACQQGVPLASAKKIGVVASRRWRYRADLLSRQWNAEARKRGLKTEFHALDLPWEESGADIPLARVYADLASRPEQLERLAQALAKLSDAADGLILPPLFPSEAAFEKVRASVPTPLCEALASTEIAPGHRLHRALRTGMKNRNIPVHEVLQVKAQTSGDAIREVSVLRPGVQTWETFRAQEYVFAGGRFFSGGLAHGYQRAEEPLFGVPLFSKAQGVRTDAQCRPLAEDGKAVFQNLRACGSVIGGVQYAEHQIGLGWFAYAGRRCGFAIA
ncbi:FAD-dependent oxidoreductase [bacterium]|nr:FAD-dependent oxidoreductase [bacterium]